jgi:hypothetical protein
MSWIKLDKFDRLDKLDTGCWMLDVGLNGSKSSKGLRGLKGSIN